MVLGFMSVRPLIAFENGPRLKSAGPNGKKSSSCSASAQNWKPGAEDRSRDGGYRRQSVNLPAGTAGFRTIPGNLNIFDEKLALDWCQTNLPDAIRIEKSLSKTALKSYVEATGDLPGVDLRTSATRFHIR